MIRTAIRYLRDDHFEQADKTNIVEGKIVEGGGGDGMQAGGEYRGENQAG